MARVPDRSALRRPGLRSDPGLRAPVEAFGAGIGEALTIFSGQVDAARQRIQARKERERAAQEEERRRREEEERRRREEEEKRRQEEEEELPPLPPRKPERTPSLPPRKPEPKPPLPGRKPRPPVPSRKPQTPEAAAERLHRGAITAARRAQAAAGRREMTEAVRAVLDGAGQPAAGLPAAVKAQADTVLKSRLAAARKAGLGEEDLARLEADLGSHQVVLLEQGLVEQGARLRAQTAEQLESEAGALVEAVQGNPARASEAAAALDDLVADFAAGVDPARLATFAEQSRARLALAEVEGFLGSGDPEAAADALGAAETLPEAARSRLAQRVETERTRQPEENRKLAEHARAEALAALEAGRGPDPETLTQIAELAGPESLAGLEAEAEAAAGRRDLAGQLSGQPRAAWDRVLSEAGADPEEQEAVLRLAEPLRRRVEQDPRAAVAARVEARIAALAAQGQLRKPSQEARARRFLAAAFQREAGIAAPRIFTNQERADWVEAYRDAEPEARPALLLSARAGGADPGDETAPPDEAALAELIAGLPAELRAEAEAQAATIAELEEAGIDPASVDLTRADPDSLYGLRDPRLAPGPAQARQLAQAGGDDAGGAAGEGAADPFRRRERETTDAWVLRLQHELRAAEGAEARLPIYEAFLQALAEDPAARGALAQGMGPEAHLTAQPAPEHVQADYDRALASGELRADEGLPFVLGQLYFVGPDGKLYRRGTEQDDSLLPAFAEQIELWMARDEVGQGGERRQALQLLLEEFGQALLTRGRMPPTRRLGIGDGSEGDATKASRADPGSASDDAASRFGSLPVETPIREFEVGGTTDGGRKVFQPSNDANELLRRARAQESHLRKQLEDLDRALPGAEIDGVRIKDIDEQGFRRLQQKIDQGWPPEMIPDYAAGRLFAASPADVDRIITGLEKRFEIVNIDDFLESPRGSGGYRAVHVQVLLPDGMTAEVQIQPSTFRVFLVEAHALYRETRQRSEEPPEGKAERRRRVAEMRRRYREAYEAWVEGSRPQ